MTRIVLASTSPRRRELLSRVGVRFAVAEPTAAEMTMPPGMCSDLAAQLIARAKAIGVAATQPQGTFVLAADTMVIGPAGLLGKPLTPARAREMLLELSGTRHSVVTGICAVAAGSGHEAMGVSRSTVRFREIPAGDLDMYVASGEPLDKAGGYAIQGGAAGWVEGVTGRVDTVIGLDVALALRLLTEAGYPMPLPLAADMPLAPRQQRRPLSPMRPARV
ncbi:MAG TPA: Maf family protein [Candidatus Dormibacteraeota bacterium]